MSKRGKLNRSKSRRTTPWDDSPRPTPVQRFIKVHYQTRYEERHQPLDETGEAEMINSFEPKHCPFCQSESFIKYGHDRNGINRYKCVCGKSFKPTTGTIFDSRKIGICEWIEYCLNIFRYVSLNADSWNNRNAISTSKYWLEKLFLTLENSQSNVVLSGTVWLLDKDDFLLSCQQIVEMLSNTAALDKKIEAQYIYLNGLTVSMQEFIKENAMEAQDEDFYETKMTEYNMQKADAEKVLHDLQDKRAARLSRKELLEGLIRTMSREGIVTNTFDGKLWLLLVEKATVGTDGKLTFTLRNGMEIEV